MKRDEGNILKSVYQARVEGRRSRGRQRLRWKEKVERDMKEMGLRTDIEGSGGGVVERLSRLSVKRGRKEKTLYSDQEFLMILENTLKSEFLYNNFVVFCTT